MKKIKALMFVAVLLITAPLFSQNECNGIGQPTRWGRDSRGVQHQLECIDTDGRLAFKGLLGKTIGGRIMAMAPFYSSLNKAITDAIAAGGGIVDATGGNLSDIGSFDSGSSPVTIYLGSRTYNVGQITLRKGLRIIGSNASDAGTILQSTDANKNTFVLPNAALVTNVLLEGFRLYGANGNATQTALDFSFNSASGGLWHSDFIDIDIQGYAGKVVKLSATNVGSGAVIQFVNFTRVNANRTNSGDYALYVLGNVGQISFLNCQFVGTWGVQDNKPNIWIGQENTATSTYPYSLLFHLPTIQDGSVGITVAGATGIKFSGGHYENLKGLLYVTTGAVGSYGSSGIDVSDSWILNHTGEDSGNGYLVKVNDPSNGSIVFSRNKIDSTPDAMYSGVGGNIVASLFEATGNTCGAGGVHSCGNFFTRTNAAPSGSSCTKDNLGATWVNLGASWSGSAEVYTCTIAGTWSQMAFSSGVYQIIGQQQGDSTTLTGTTNETVLYTLTIPAGTFALNSSMVVNVWGLNGANTGTVRYRVRIGGLSGQLIGDSTTTSANANVRMHVVFRNRNSLSSNTFSVEGSFGGTILNNGAGSSSVNTANSQDLVITGQLSNGADTGIVKWAEVLLAK